MIVFDYTDNYVESCRDCTKNVTCEMTKFGKEQSHLPCMNARFEPRLKRTTNSSWDYDQLKRQLTIMRCTIESEKYHMMMDDNRPESLKGANHNVHTFTHYCVFEYALKSYYTFLLENSARSDNSEFVNDAIRTAIVLEDDATITINSANKSIVEWIKKDLKQKGCRVN